MSTWQKFEGDGQVPAFIDAAVALHRPLFDRLALGERPFFIDHWLLRFNHSDSWLLPASDGGPALVTVPRVEDHHGYRWQVRTLAMHTDCRDLELPSAVDVNRSFLMPCSTGVPSTASALAGMRAEPVQLGYVVGIDDVSPPSGHDWVFHESCADDVEPILALIDRAYTAATDRDASKAVEPPDLSREREELREYLEYNAAWCFHATVGDGSTPIAMASYLAMSLPLLGVPTALTGDLAVDVAHRRQGLARTLQRFASLRLRQDGIRWLHGNIDPANSASRSQAEGIGRSIWWAAVRFKPA